MKKLIVLASLIGASYIAKSQVTVTPEVGYNLGKFWGFTYDPYDNVQYTKNFEWKGSPRFGVAFKIPVGKGGFSIEPGLYYNSRFATVKTSSPVVDVVTNTRFNFVELPINLRYDWEVSRYTGKLFWEVSPYVGYAVSGYENRKETIKIPEAKVEETETTLEWGSEINQYKPLDYGVYFGMGYQFQWGMQIRAKYGVSFSNFSNLPNDVTNSGSVFNFSVGYVFNRRIPGRFY